MCAVLVSWVSPIPFRSALVSARREEGSGDLGPLYVNLYQKLNRANEIAEHIIRIDLSHEWDNFSNYIPCDWQGKNVQEVVLATVVEARQKLEYDLRRQRQKVVVNFVKSHFNAY